MKKCFIPEDNLFPRKEDFILACTPFGKFKFLMNLPKSQRLKAELHNMHMMGSMEFTNGYGLPIIAPYRYTIDPRELTFVPFSSRNEVAVAPNVAVTFFEDDYKFATATWSKLDVTTYKLTPYSTLLTPDHSLYVDMPDAFNLQQLYRSRFAGAVWQQYGFDVIATASWGSVDTFRYCFDGLPHNSVIAVCGMGVKWCPAATTLWDMAIRELVYQLSPSLIIVYGQERTVPGVNTPMLFIPPYVTSKLKKIIQ